MSKALWFVGGVAVGAAGFYYGNKYIRNLIPGLSGLGEGAGTDALKHAVQVHVRQIRRYAFASSQDLSPIVGLTHASYALVLLDTLEELIGQAAIRAAGYDPKKIRAFITSNQDRHAEAMRACDPHLQKVLAIERADPNGADPGFVLADAPPQPWHPDPVMGRPMWAEPNPIPDVRGGRGLFMGADAAMSAPRGA